MISPMHQNKLNTRLNFRSLSTSVTRWCGTHLMRHWYKFLPFSFLFSRHLVPRCRHFVPRCRHFTPHCRHFMPRCRHFMPRCRHFMPCCRHFMPRCRHFVPRCRHFVPRCRHFVPYSESFDFWRYLRPRASVCGLRNNKTLRTNIDQAIERIWQIGKHKTVEIGFRILLHKQGFSLQGKDVKSKFSTIKLNSSGPCGFSWNKQLLFDFNLLVSINETDYAFKMFQNEISFDLASHAHN